MIRAFGLSEYTTDILVNGTQQGSFAQDADADYDATISPTTNSITFTATADTTHRHRELDNLSTTVLDTPDCDSISVSGSVSVGSESVSIYWEKNGTTLSSQTGDNSNSTFNFGDSDGTPGSDTWTLRTEYSGGVADTSYTVGVSWTVEYTVSVPDGVTTDNVDQTLL